VVRLHGEVRGRPQAKKAVAVIADTVGYNDEPYRQVGEVMLLTRVVALVEQGKLLADGDPWDMFTYRIRLPA